MFQERVYCTVISNNAAQGPQRQHKERAQVSYARGPGPETKVLQKPLNH